ncbi:hypothetical protein OB2597_04445 [Pseudooceanicola batsensis HTCC2597]|uniref:Uncharacterized protein n=1 Tax=Pseudooceanicola batsensis (strain ATCC BAA-863 / DSM 15984 / KCTC 12145 / HTCC2597) TaxID=252305 RepID=A3U3M1_PSEBH|nr:hypothetical protein OB2597_04445 [Pseudooceanicola batsensis HTCC2597]
MISQQATMQQMMMRHVFMPPA